MENRNLKYINVNNVVKLLEAIDKKPSEINKQLGWPQGTLEHYLDFSNLIPMDKCEKLANCFGLTKSWAYQAVPTNGAIKKHARHLERMNAYHDKKEQSLVSFKEVQNNKRVLENALNNSDFEIDMNKLSQALSAIGIQNTLVTNLNNKIDKETKALHDGLIHLDTVRQQSEEKHEKKQAQILQELNEIKEEFRKLHSSSKPGGDKHE